MRLALGWPTADIPTESLDDLVGHLISSVIRVFGPVIVWKCVLCFWHHKGRAQSRNVACASISDMVDEWLGFTFKDVDEILWDEFSKIRYKGIKLLLDKTLDAVVNRSPVIN